MYKAVFMYINTFIYINTLTHAILSPIVQLKFFRFFKIIPVY